MKDSGLVFMELNKIFWFYQMVSHLVLNIAYRELETHRYASIYEYFRLFYYFYGNCS